MNFLLTITICSQIKIVHNIVAQFIFNLKESCFCCLDSLFLTKFNLCPISNYFN